MKIAPRTKRHALVLPSLIVLTEKLTNSWTRRQKHCFPKRVRTLGRRESRGLREKRKFEKKIDKYYEDLDEEVN